MDQRSQEEKSVAVMVERPARGQREDEEKKEKRQEKQWLCAVIEA